MKKICFSLALSGLLLTSMSLAQTTPRPDAPREQAQTGTATPTTTSAPVAGGTTGTTTTTTSTTTSSAPDTFTSGSGQTYTKTGDNQWTSEDGHTVTNPTLNQDGVLIGGRVAASSGLIGEGTYDPTNGNLTEGRLTLTDGTVAQGSSDGDGNLVDGTITLPDGTIAEFENGRCKTNCDEYQTAAEDNPYLRELSEEEVQRYNMSEGVKALQSQTGSFDLSKLSVGNEHLLTIGGAENDNHNVLARIINIMARLFGTVAVLVIVLGAFFMITSRGDENQLQKGKTIVGYTILGLLIGFTAYILVQFVINILFQT